ncbi:hypothetical protein GUJ93_ZPchr0010g8889 [Zizania palustris]|uniref:DUF3119 family protein n=1 Tax=Zizania palustris TaxID=103762 RepID=A0A8J6BHV3_ZIZPA|nr:hypothetical protein GUJ93_ZPchr0010g8889 [Zizania palustris]
MATTLSLSSPLFLAAPPRARDVVLCRVDFASPTWNSCRFGRKSKTRETVVPNPDYRLPIAILGISGAFAYADNLLAAAPVGLLGLLLLFQTTRVRFVFDDESLEVKVGDQLQESGENVFVGGKNRWKYSTFVNWELWWPQFPILVYFKETQTKPEGQIHFFPVILRAKATTVLGRSTPATAGGGRRWRPGRVHPGGGSRADSAAPYRSRESGASRASSARRRSPRQRRPRRPPAGKAEKSSGEGEEGGEEAGGFDSRAADRGTAGSGSPQRASLPFLPAVTTKKGEHRRSPAVPRGRRRRRSPQWRSPPHGEDDEDRKSCVSWYSTLCCWLRPPG